jgi:ubiquinone/menaquinone biosynthesis C-methylase UbiE
MTTTPISTQSTRSKLANTLINGILAVPPLASFAKQRARAMMINRAEALGVPWRQRVQELQARHGQTGNTVDSAAATAGLASGWEEERSQIETPDLAYPDYYLTSFHAYDEGNMGWTPAMEVEVASLAVHARLWPELGIKGDAQLRQSYHDVLTVQLPDTLHDIVDLGCGVGMSTQALQAMFPMATMTGVDLSPYFLAIARYRDQQRLARPESSSSPPHAIRWVHRAAENTHLPAHSYDLVSACLVFHELPQQAARNILSEARRIIRPGGYLSIMDMNPGCDTFMKMPSFVFTLLKSTEPYLDEYLSLDLEQAIYDAGFQRPTVTITSPRHRTLVAQTR